MISFRVIIVYKKKTFCWFDIYYLNCYDYVPQDRPTIVLVLF